MATAIRDVRQKERDDWAPRGVLPVVSGAVNAVQPMPDEERAQRLMGHVHALFPICRSITGPGLRETLAYVGRQIPLRVSSVPSGTKVLDWEVPLEWVPRSAAIRRLSGETVVDFTEHNLHLLQYSEGFDGIVPRDQLDRHLHSLPDQPDLIPYRTSYYARTWGFCLAHRVRAAMTDPAYQVSIDADLKPGSLNYGECFIPGAEDGEILLSVHSCHPSLANDNLSGVSVAIEFVRDWMTRPHRLGLRAVFLPGTIGAIAWLAANRERLGRISHGLVLTCLGDGGAPTYKRSQRENTAIDRAAGYAFEELGIPDRITPFVPYGYDERQYCSPGFDLPVGCLMRSPNGSFPEYHTSADNLDFVRADALAGSLRLLQRVLWIAEHDRAWRNTEPFGEPQLGRRGLYAAIGGTGNSGLAGFDQLTLLWVLNQSNGRASLLEIAERANKPFDAVVAAAGALAEAGLLVLAD